MEQLRYVAKIIKTEDVDVPMNSSSDNWSPYDGDDQLETKTFIKDINIIGIGKDRNELITKFVSYVYENIIKDSEYVKEFYEASPVQNYYDEEEIRDELWEKSECEIGYAHIILKIENIFYLD